MSSFYRTTVINHKTDEESLFCHPDLSSAVHWGEDNSDVGETVQVDEVMTDACGDHVVLKKVMEYVKKED
jgi:hypothetical protein